MKIALVRSRYNPFGGAEQFVNRAIAALRTEGSAEITLITRQWEAGNTKDGAAPSSLGFKVKIVNPKYHGRVWRDVAFAFGVRRVMEEQEFDLVQSHERIAGCDVYRAGDGVHAQWLANRRRGMKGLCGWARRIGMHFNLYHSYMCAAERHMFHHQSLRAVVCNSELVRKEILAHFLTPPEKLHVIYNGVDLERFNPNVRIHRSEIRQKFGIAEAAPVFLLVGSGFERKGVGRLIKALADCGQTESQALPHAIIVGEDKHMARYRAIADRYGIADRVHFAGGQKDVVPFYGAADCFVLPTIYDPFPNAALEAMACGLPVITTRQCGAAEFVERTGQPTCGAVIDAYDIAGLTTALSQFSDPTFARQMGSIARERVANLSLENMASELLALYRTLLEGSPIRPRLL